MMDSNAAYDLRARVAACAKAARASGLFAGTSGNLSAYCAKERCVAITPSGVDYDSMTADDIVLVSAEGDVIFARPGLRPSSETPLHLEIYRARPDVGGVVHTHSPYATAFAAAGRGVPCTLIEMVFFLGGDIPLAPFELPGSRELGLGAVDALRERGGCLLESHGALAIGADIEQALLRAEYMEDVAKICALAGSLGGAKPLSADLIEKMRDK